jgi:hypothetical protein
LLRIAAKFFRSLDPVSRWVHHSVQGTPRALQEHPSAAYGASSESALTYDKDMREWVCRHFLADPREPVR